MKTSAPPSTGHMNGKAPATYEHSAALNGNGASSNHDYDMHSDGDDIPLSQIVKPADATSTGPPRAAKRKPGPYAQDSSSDDDDRPLASSPVKPSSANSRKPKLESDQSDSDAPIKSRARNGNGKPPKKKLKVESNSSDDDKDDEPLETSRRPPPRSRKPKSDSASEDAKPIKQTGSSDDDEDDDDDKPLKAKRAPARSRKAKIESDSEDEKPLKKAVAPKKARAKKVKAEDGASESEAPKPKATRKPKKEAAPKKAKKKEEKEEEEVFRWWDANDPNGDGSTKWTTLEHNGVIFPPPYEPLPPHVKMKYNGKKVKLSAEGEEVAGFYAALLETPHAEDKVFNQNFFNDFKKVLEEHPPIDGTKIKNFELCDFRPMFDYFEEEKAKKKAMSKEEKKAIKDEKDAFEAKYMTCLLDGRKEKVGNFRVEPPGLFRGRGDHPKKGALKYRVRPEDITINIGEGVPIPVPNMPGRWKSVQHDQTVTWLANWTENVNHNHKYVFLAPGSSLKGQSDMLKFEKARELKKHVSRIRENYNADLRSKVMADRQRATTMYFIDKLALRAGNEKGEDEADTVGCCSLRCEHVTLEGPDWIIFDFLGKDSIRYYNRVQVDPQVFKNIRIFKENKEDSDNLFDRVSTTTLNKHLTNEMKGLTAKVFRTYNASITFQRLLDEDDLEDATVAEKLTAYNKANREVAILCNHQRAAPKTHDQSMEKMRQKFLVLKYERMKLCHTLFAMDSKYKKKPEFREDEAEIDETWVAEYEESLKLKEIEKAEAKFAKENEKLVEEDKKPHDDSVLKKRIANIEADFKRLEDERGTSLSSKKFKTAEAAIEAIKKMSTKIKAFELQMLDKDAGKEVALGTSKINYLDPRITAAWCKKNDVPIEKMFSKTLLVKFPWALEVDSDWKF